VLGERLACRTLAGEGRHIGGLGHRTLGGNLVLGRRALELFERQFHLIEQPHRAFRVLAVELSRQLCDLQLLVSDQGPVIGGLRLGYRQFRFDPGCPGALGKQRHLQRVYIVRQAFTGDVNAGIESQIHAADSQKCVGPIRRASGEKCGAESAKVTRRECMQAA
jgi:hypothetical protein